MKKLWIILLFLSANGLFAQQKNNTILPQDLYRVENDSITIDLEEVVVLKNRNFSSEKERRYYYWYYKKVQKAYPYAILATKKMEEIDREVGGLSNKRKQKKYIRQMQKYLEGEFTEEVKGLTRTEGRILIKLIHRQTGQNFYTLIQDYRSDWKAFWYNSSAKFFKLNLKDEYHPESIALDFVIEDILNRSFANGTLEKQPSKLPIDYFELSNQWKNISFYEVINQYIQKYK